jgi:hypothetical protein
MMEWSELGVLVSTFLTSLRSAVRRPAIGEVVRLCREGWVLRRIVQRILVHVEV